MEHEDWNDTPPRYRVRPTLADRHAAALHRARAEYDGIMEHPDSDAAFELIADLCELLGGVGEFLSAADGADIRSMIGDLREM